MARPLRIELPGAAYYVTSRGLEGQGIVRDEEDCGRWLARLDAVATRRRWRVVAFAVMQSHHHLLVETPEANLSAGMHDLNAGYAMAFNWRHGRHGPLFAGRFKAILIEPGYRYWEISRHIHLNPVRLGHAKRAQDWPFGSCAAYVDGTVLAPAWLRWREVLVGHGATMAEARDAYSRSLAEGVERPGVSPLWAATPGVGLGSPQFVRRLGAWLEGRRRRAGQASAGGTPAPPLLAGGTPAPRVEAIERAVCAVFGVEEGRLRE
ncbi:MAG: addiction module toxin RelE, partial [Planctomycetes bacterium]|nr:addiction module toxin RelE [Planctomycetota bacterium]